jgi:hypothetical protein
VTPDRSSQFSSALGDTMGRGHVLRSVLFLVGLLACAVSGQAQTEVGADLGLLSSYVWRGLSLTNKPVVQPDLYVAIPIGTAFLTMGGWANIDLGRYNDLADDISESGGSSSFNLAEFDWWGEVSYPIGRATLTGGATGYIFPNDTNAPNDFGLLTKGGNTVEIYGKAEFDAPLSPRLSIYYDVDKVKGAYFEGSISHFIEVSEKVSVDLGATAGFNAGMGVSADDPSFRFADDGFTHLDLSAGVPFTTGPLSFTPVIHLVLSGDDRVKVTSPANLSKDVKLWGGVSISWSRALGPEPEDTVEE